MTDREPQPTAKTSGDIARAALLGASSGMRTFSALATLALRDRLGAGPIGRAAIVVAAVGELCADKHPAVPPRISAPGLGARLVAGAYSGHRVAGRPGAAVAGTASVCSAVASYHARATLVRRLALPDVVVAAVEDAVAYGIATLAIRL
jgi:uncharacterized membrane protein